MKCWLPICILTLYCPSAVRLSSSTDGTVATRYESERPVYWILNQFGVLSNSMDDAWRWWICLCNILFGFVLILMHFFLVSCVWFSKLIKATTIKSNHGWYKTNKIIKYLLFSDEQKHKHKVMNQGPAEVFFDSKRRRTNKFSDEKKKKNRMLIVIFLKVSGRAGFGNYIIILWYEAKHWNIANDKKRWRFRHNNWMMKMLRQQHNFPYQYFHSAFEWQAKRFNWFQFRGGGSFPALYINDWGHGFLFTQNFLFSTSPLEFYSLRRLSVSHRKAPSSVT